MNLNTELLLTIVKKLDKISTANLEEKEEDVQVLDITSPLPTSKDELMQADEYACISPIYQRL